MGLTSTIRQWVAHKSHFGVGFRAFSNELPDVSGKTLPSRWRADQLQDATQNCGGGWGTALYRQIHRNDLGHGTAACVACAEDAAACPTISDSNDQFGIGHGVVRPQQNLLHVDRHWSGDHEHIGMAWTGNKFYASSFEIVIRIVQRVDFKFAAIARSRINVANSELPSKNSSDVLLQCRSITSSAVWGWQRLGYKAGSIDTEKGIQDVF